MASSAWAPIRSICIALRPAGWRGGVGGLGVDVIACPIEGMRRRAQLGIGGNVLDLDRPSRKRDDREAARLYKLSADQGNAYAQDNLCRFYEPRSAEVV